jgi:arabinogalactan oligomer / maltooligosaccharide transport system substrate-binding protein
MRRSPVVVAGVAGVTLLMGACGGGSPTASPTTSSTSSTTTTASATASPTETKPVRDAKADLVIWADEKRANALKAVAEKFGQDNGITVAVQTVATDLQTNFVTANTAGNGPDVVVGAHDWIGNMVQNGAISPLPLSEADQAKYQPIAIKGVTYNGQVYGLPYAVENVALFRNTDAAPSAPATIEQLVKDGTAAVKAGKVSGVLNLQVGQNGDAYHLEPLYTSGGGYLFGTKANGDYDPTDVGVGKPGSVAAMKKIAALGEKGSKVLKRSVSGDNSIALFTQKKAAYLVSGPWAIADIKKAGIKYDISPVPPFAGGKAAAPFIGVQAFYIASKAKNASLAQEFVLNAVNTPDTMKALFDAEPRPPAMTQVLQQVSASDPDISKLAAAAKNGQILPAIPAMAAVWDPLGKAEAAIIGGANPTTTITNAGKTIRASIK